MQLASGGGVLCTLPVRCATLPHTVHSHCVAAKATGPTEGAQVCVTQSVNSAGQESEAAAARRDMVGGRECLRPGGTCSAQPLSTDPYPLYAPAETLVDWCSLKRWALVAGRKGRAQWISGEVDRSHRTAAADPHNQERVARQLRLYPALTEGLAGGCAEALRALAAGGKEWPAAGGERKGSSGPQRPHLSG